MAVLGAVSGGGYGYAIGAIGAMGIPKEQSRMYKERLKQGDILLAIRTRREDAPRAKSVLLQHGAREIFSTV
jgi:hypothetical protein